MKRVLAIETSCDDTSVAIVNSDRYCEICISQDQIMVHEPFGGVVPEIASRNHTRHILPLIEEVLSKTQSDWNTIDGIAVTNRPGLMGALMAGVVSAKALAYTRDLPVIGVNHLVGHIFAPFVCDENHKPQAPKYPFVALAVSGGHTSIYRVDGYGDYQVLGKTIDDAAGEALDKFAKMLGLGFPGGPIIDKLAVDGDPSAFEFPRSMLRSDNLDFSFSGLKASAQRAIAGLKEPYPLADLCASFQAAVTEILASKLLRAIDEVGAQMVVLTGGVSANSELRERVSSQIKDVDLMMPPIRYCMDNAAMIGYVGAQDLALGKSDSWRMTASPNSFPGDFK